MYALELMKSVVGYKSVIFRKTWYLSWKVMSPSIWQRRLELTLVSSGLNQHDQHEFSNGGGVDPVEVQPGNGNTTGRAQYLLKLCNLGSGLHRINLPEQKVSSKWSGTHRFMFYLPEEKGSYHQAECSIKIVLEVNDLEPRKGKGIWPRKYHLRFHSWRALTFVRNIDAVCYGLNMSPTQFLGSSPNPSAMESGGITFGKKLGLNEVLMRFMFLKEDETRALFLSLM